MPFSSRALTVRIESPGGNAATVDTRSQYWIVLIGAPGVRSLGSCVGSTLVQGADAVNTWNRHAKSFSVSLITWLFSSKLGGSIPGMPPPPCDAGPLSHTAVVGLFPMLRLLWICRSVRLLGGTGVSDFAGFAKLRPGTASTTRTNCEPLLTEKMRRPISSSAGVGVGMCTQLESQQNKQ